MKLRLSYGVTGNDRIPAYQSLSRTDKTYYSGDNNLYSWVCRLRRYRTPTSSGRRPISSTEVWISACSAID
ncbi:MAG: hypothetical protein ACLSH3_00445 [Alistipes finegoldii]